VMPDGLVVLPPPPPHPARRTAASRVTIPLTCFNSQPSPRSQTPRPAFPAADNQTNPY